MKRFLFRHRKGQARGGFSLVEATLSLGLVSFGLLTLAPLLALGMKTAREARNDRATAQIAQTLIEQAKQGTLATGTTYLDLSGNVTVASAAAYSAQAAVQPVAAGSPLERLTLTVIPAGAPDRTRTYAVVFLPSS